MHKYRITPLILCPLTLLSLMVAARVSADDLSHADKLRVLYSNQFAFDRRGAPLITIGIVEGVRQVVIESETPLRVLPDGEDGSKVIGGRRWKIRLKRSTAAHVEYAAVLAREPATALKAIRQTMRKWQARGARCHLVEVGTLFGIKGKVVDNRAYVLTDGPYATDSAARATAERYLRKGWLSRVGVLPTLKRRPSGQIEAVDLDQGRTRVLVRDAIWFSPTRSAKLHVSGGNRHRSAKPYWGQIYVTIGKDGKLAVVNAVPADRLLAGLVPAEIFPSAPRAALRAQSVAARGDLLAKIGSRHLVDPFLICARQHCQVYRGAGSEHPRTTDAVAATKGMVLVRPDGGLVKAVYSAACGGHSEHNDKVWAVKADPQLRGHLDGESSSLAPYRGGINASNIVAWLNSRPKTWCSMSSYNRDKFRWTTRIPLRALNKMVRKLAVGPVKAIKVISRGRSGRANLVEISGALGKRHVRGELRIRRLFGGLRSSMFLVSRQDKSSGPEFVFKGGGWGHGVGMCQTGATGMAQAGKKYQAILEHYYPGSLLQPLY